MEKITGIIAIIIIVICVLPLISPEAKIEVTIYMSFPFLLFGGAIGFIIARIEGIIVGALLGMILPVLWQSMQTVLSSLP